MSDKEYLDMLELLAQGVVDGEHNPLHSVDESVAYALAHTVLDLIKKLR